MPDPVILVTGANGQLGTAIKQLSVLYPQFHYKFLVKHDLPIHQSDKVEAYFNEIQPAYCINCAAYTAVDKAETEKELAMLVNGEAVGVLATVCKSTGTKFLHVSTDYVFDGTGTSPYQEDDFTNPVNYYGVTKLQGEQLCMQYNAESIIIRTSWVYATHGNNFVKTMLRLMKERDNLNVVNDQFGSPTYAADLAGCILSVVAANEAAGKRWTPGIYHYSNEGIINWFDFATAIGKLSGSNCQVHPVPATAYPTAARRPAYSGMSKEKIKSIYKLVIPAWEKSLALCISELQ
ncbi:MAG: dTDP-4-dehydrorhamnose reductase [Chitinophagaceae bacterium]